MPELGLFPLALVLLPHARLPLPIFADRHQDLIAASMAPEGLIGRSPQGDTGRRPGRRVRGDRLTG